MEDPVEATEEVEIIHKDSNEQDDNKENEAKEEKEAEVKAEDEWLDVIGSGDLMKKVIKKGKGENTRPTHGNIITVNIIGNLEDGRHVERAENKKVTVGDAEVVQGLDLIFPLMELEEEAEIKIKARLAYGKLGKTPEIPPNADITYTVQLLKIEDEPEFETLSVAQRMTIGDGKREHGNFWYSRGEFTQAIQCYRRALDYLDDTDANFTETSQELQKLLENRLKVHNNMAAAHLKAENYDAALKSVEQVLRVQPENVKALFRKGKILSIKGKTEDAIQYMKKALKLCPEMKVIHQELSVLMSKQKNEVSAEKQMYKRMFGQDKTPGTKNTGKKSFFKWGLMFGGVTAALVSIFAYRHFHASF